MIEACVGEELPLCFSNVELATGLRKLLLGRVDEVRYPLMTGVVAAPVAAASKEDDAMAAFVVDGGSATLDVTNMKTLVSGSKWAALLAVNVVEDAPGVGCVCKPLAAALGKNVLACAVVLPVLLLRIAAVEDPLDIDVPPVLLEMSIEVKLVDLPVGCGGDGVF